MVPGGPRFRHPGFGFLRQGVEDAIKTLGRGFLAHPENSTFRAKTLLQILVAQDYYRQLLRMVYRLLFLFVAEDRDPITTKDEKILGIVAHFYSSARLPHLAEGHRGTRHCDPVSSLGRCDAKTGHERWVSRMGFPIGQFSLVRKAMPPWRRVGYPMPIFSKPSGFWLLQSMKRCSGRSIIEIWVPKNWAVYMNPSGIASQA